MPIIQEQEQQPDMVYKTMPKIKAGGSFAAPPPAPRAPLRPQQTAAPQMPERNILENPVPGQSQKNKILKALLIALIILLLLGLAFTGYIYFVRKPQQEKAAKQAAETQRQLEEKRKAEQTAKPQSKISDDWRLKYFNASVCANQANCGDEADPDQDGLDNYEEFTLNTDPNNPDSDADGIADGDEVHVFNYNPGAIATTGNSKYPDNFQVKTKWNTSAKREFNDAELKVIVENIKKYGLHIPTTTTLDIALVNFYTNYGTPAATPTAEPGALDRDTQRAEAVKQVGFALLKYKDANNGKYPDVQDFAAMIIAIKPLLSGKAVNTTDPKNTPPYIYGYQSVNSGKDFKLSYFSETTNQAVINDSKTMSTLYGKDQAAQRDLQRQTDLELISQALALYSLDANPTDFGASTFPPQQTWKADLAPQYIQSIPADPQTKQDYVYTVNGDFTDFALQAQLETPPSGKKGYLCNSAGCGYY